MAPIEQAQFKRLRLSGWRQFLSVEIDFHPRLTVVTGANGAGKTTLLNILNRFVGWNLPIVSSGSKWSDIKDDVMDYWKGEPTRNRPNEIPFGSIWSSDDKEHKLCTPREHSTTYQIAIRPGVKLPGVFIPSHRPEYFHAPLKNIPTSISPEEELLKQYINQIRARFNIGAQVTAPIVQLKSSLVSLALFGYGNDAVEANPDALQTFLGFQDILTKVLPTSLGFRRLIITPPDVVLLTDTGRFPLDAVSGGVASIIDMSWQIFMISRLHRSFAVIMDEPETHLHPELQRELLPNLLDAFPGGQFIAASHNPFIISSERDSSVFALSYNKEQRVISKSVDISSRTGNASDILSDVLGIPATTPVWVDRLLESIISKYSGKIITRESLGSLRDELQQSGLHEYSASAITRLLDKAQRDD